MYVRASCDEMAKMPLGHSLKKETIIPKVRWGWKITKRGAKKWKKKPRMLPFAFRHAALITITSARRGDPGARLTRGING